MTSALGLAGAFLLGASAPQLPDTGAVAERRRAVESGLLPDVRVEGEPGFDLRDRMRAYGVPGLAVAVMNDGRIEWTAGYGVKRAGEPDAVEVSTLFQAASLSKPVTAAAVLRLADEGRVELDRDVSGYLRSWALPEGEQTADRRVTLRRLLSHSAGVNVHGFGGVPRGADLSAAPEVLEGRDAPEPIRVTRRPGDGFRYSGGGYQIAQVVLEDVSGEPFAAWMDREVLAPLGMERSTFRQPLPDSLVPAAASGHARGETVRGGWEDQPAGAAAGLWTTPADLARLALGIRAAWLGEPGAFLAPETARAMLTEQGGSWGLGWALVGTGEDFAIEHAGDSRGYSAFLVLYPARGDGVVVMANGQASRPLLLEVVRAVASVYGWPQDYAPEVRVPLSARLRRVLPLLAGAALLAAGLLGWRRRRAAR